MREVIVKVRCDRCGEGFDVENGSDGIQQDVALLFGGDHVLLDLCDPCVHIMENDLATLIASGRPVRPVRGKKQKQKSSPVGLRCPECREVRASPQALGIHRYRAHGVKGTSRKVNA